MPDWRTRVTCFLTPPFHHRWELVESRRERGQDPLGTTTSSMDPTMGTFESHDIRCKRCGTEKSFISSQASVQFGRKD